MYATRETRVRPNRRCDRTESVWPLHACAQVSEFAAVFPIGAQVCVLRAPGAHWYKGRAAIQVDDHVRAIAG